MPLAEVITDFFDQLKSKSKGYASMEYTVTGCHLSRAQTHDQHPHPCPSRSLLSAALCSSPHPSCTLHPAPCTLHPAPCTLHPPPLLTRPASESHTVWADRPNDLVRLDVLINGEPALPLAAIVHRDVAHATGKALTRKLKELIPRQQFKVPIQAAIGQKIVASSQISPMRKDVLAKCYGGDISRKKKLLAKQAKGKKRMKMMGQVNVPQEAFMAVLNLKGGS